VKREDKTKAVELLHDEFISAKSSVLIDYKGLDVAAITDLRSKLREVDIEFHVVKNTLSKIAAKGTAFEKLEPFFKGPTAITLSKKDPVAGIKVLDLFKKEKPVLEYKAAVVDGSLIKKEDISKFAALPSKEVLLAKLLGTLQAPVAGFVRVLAGNITGLMNVLNGIKDSKPGN
jgi:large subunit ribosomal protein L10